MSQTDTDRRTDTMVNTMSNLQISEIGSQRVNESLIPVDGISFYIMRLSKAIVVHTTGEFFIGRDVEEISKPLVDLSGLDGFEMGVSRRHAMIRPLEHGYEVTDLSSTNGTFLNEQRLIPNKPYSLTPGARLRVGQEQLLVVYRSARVSQK